MKNVLFLILTILTLTGCSCQKAITEIHQKLDTKKDKEIVFVKLISDSRCPEKVQCIWAGEVTFEVAAYEKGKLIEQKQFTLNIKTQEEIIRWFSEHLPTTKEKLKEIAVFPYPKNDVESKPEDYYVKLIWP